MITSSPITFLSIAAEGICRKRLLAAGLDNLLDVAMHESSGSCGYLVVKIKKRSDEDFDKIIGALRLGADDATDFAALAGWKLT